MDEDSGGSGGGERPMGSVMRSAGKFFPLIFVVGWGVAMVVWAASDSQVGWQHEGLKNAMGWLVGSFFVAAGIPHLFFSEPIARSIGWAPSPFQWEVGMSGVGMGVLGFMAATRGRGFVLATIIMVTVFLWGAAVGHVREMIRERNFAPGNAGPIFVYDVLLPAFLIYLYAATD